MHCFGLGLGQGDHQAEGPAARLPGHGVKGVVFQKRTRNDQKEIAGSTSHRPPSCPSTSSIMRPWAHRPSRHPCPKHATHLSCGLGQPPQSQSGKALHRSMFFRGALLRVWVPRRRGLTGSPIEVVLLERYAGAPHKVAQATLLSSWTRCQICSLCLWDGPISGSVRFAGSIGGANWHSRGVSALFLRGSTAPAESPRMCEICWRVPMERPRMCQTR